MAKVIRKFMHALQTEHPLVALSDPLTQMPSQLSYQKGNFTSPPRSTSASLVLVTGGGVEHSVLAFYEPTSQK